MFTKQHYELLAGIVKDSGEAEEHTKALMEEYGKDRFGIFFDMLVYYLKRDNPQFDEARFRDSAGYPPHHWKV